jgi:anti-sigma regulatory factor (Ser/Thr protein kinase)
MESAGRRVNGAIIREAFATWQADLSTPKAARDVVTAMLSGAGCEDLVDDAQLLTSELVTNSVVHAPGAVALHAELHEDGLHVAVHDRIDVLAVSERGVAEVDDEHGRGLAIVAGMASAWASEPAPDGHGKVTWFELRHRADGPDRRRPRSSSRRSRTRRSAD